jgi:hypothetical protein
VVAVYGGPSRDGRRATTPKRRRHMSEDKGLSHVENLVPGFVTLLMVATLLPPGYRNPIQNPDVVRLLAEPVFLALLAVSAAYLVGAIVFEVSRLLLNPASAWTLRPIFLRISCEGFRGKLRKGINAHYGFTLGRALSCENKPDIRQEVVRRRQRARLIRTCLAPALLAAARCPYPWVALPVAFIAILAIYAYAEVTIYQEAELAEVL